MPTANAGYHLFNTGDVLTAAQVQYNLQNQSIMYFATAAARDSALTGVLAEGMFAYLADSDTTVYYDGTSWLSLFSGQVLTSPQETATISATAATGAINIDTLTSAINIRTSDAAANYTLNVRGSATVTLDSLMSVGDSLTVTFESPNGATPYYATAYTIDGNAVTPKWLGGTAPIAGNASATDVYMLQIRKTAAATFTCIASQSKFA
jgi:hypothetical protein